MNIGFQSSLQLFPSADMENTKRFYEKIGFSSVSYLDSKEPHICLYRDSIEIVLLKSNLKKIHPNREIHGSGEDAYFISSNQEELYNELKRKGVTIIQELHYTDYSNKEFIFEDNEKRRIAVGCKVNSDVIQHMQLHHIAFFCKNIKEMELFYTKNFGFKRVKEFNKGTDKEFFMLGKDTVRIELFPSKEDAENAADSKFKHFSISVNSLTNTINHLNNRNITVDRIIDYSTPEKIFKICFIRDPENNVIEFIEGYEDDL